MNYDNEKANFQRLIMESIQTPLSDTDRKELSGPGFQAFIKIADLWGLSTKQQIKILGLSSRSTFFKWKRDSHPELPLDTLERISYILGIYKALQILLPDSNAADSWIKRPNSAPVFGGKSALDKMLTGLVADLFLVRQYLDAQRLGWS